MKMVSIIDAIFWGALLIALGVWLIVRRYVPVQVPVWRVIIAVFFVYLGVRVLAYGPGIRQRNITVFTESTMTAGSGDQRDYNVIFGSSTIDFTDLSEGSKEVNVVFGSAVLRVNTAAAVRIDASSAFGTVETPDGSSVAFGDRRWTSESWREGSPELRIKASAVFGRLVVKP